MAATNEQYIDIKIQKLKPRLVDVVYRDLLAGVCLANYLGMLLHLNLLIQKTTADDDDDDDDADKPKTPHNKLLESANLSQGKSSLGPETRVWSLDTDEFQNLMETSLSKHTSIIKFSQRYKQFVQRCEPQIVGKCPMSQH